MNNEEQFLHHLIYDVPGEIYDVPEIEDVEDFNMNDYLSSDYDY